MECSLIVRLASQVQMLEDSITKRSENGNSVNAILRIERGKD